MNNTIHKTTLIAFLLITAGIQTSQALSFSLTISSIKKYFLQPTHTQMTLTAAFATASLCATLLYTYKLKEENKLLHEKCTEQENAIHALSTLVIREQDLSNNLQTDDPPILNTIRNIWFAAHKVQKRMFKLQTLFKKNKLSSAMQKDFLATV